MSANVKKRSSRGGRMSTPGKDPRKSDDDPQHSVASHILALVDARTTWLLTALIATICIASYIYRRSSYWSGDSYIPDPIRSIVPLTDPLDGFSMILPVRNEDEFLQKCIEYFLESETNHISHICIYDDASDRPVSDWIYQAVPQAADKILVLRSDQPTGLMEGRVRCAEEARSKYLLFMDAHTRPMNLEWSQILMDDLKQNPSRASVPRVIDIDRYTWIPSDKSWKNNFESAKSTKMMFDWTFEFYWQTTLTEEIPVMVGGIYAIDRDFFFEIGAYDIGMREWGGENIEQSLRIWMCGGEIISVPTSVIGHIFNRDEKPNPNNSLVERIQMNHLRVARVFLDDYQKTFFKHHYSAAHFMRKLNSDPENIENRIDDRIDFIHQRKCNSFDWFINRFRSSFDRHGLIENDYHQLVIVPNDYDGNYPVQYRKGMSLLTWSPTGGDLKPSNLGLDDPVKGLAVDPLLDTFIGLCLSADRDGKMALAKECQLGERKVHKGTHDDFWINSMGRRVLRVRNQLAPIGTVFDISSLCFLSPRRGLFTDSKPVPARLHDCKQIENNTILKSSIYDDQGSIFVDVPRRSSRPSYERYDQAGYDAGDTGRIIWLRNTEVTVDGNDDLERDIVHHECFSDEATPGDCACLGSMNGKEIAWVRCKDTDKVLKFIWVS